MASHSTESSSKLKLGTLIKPKIEVSPPPEATDNEDIEEDEATNIPEPEMDEEIKILAELPPLEASAIPGSSSSDARHIGQCPYCKATYPSNPGDGDHKLRLHFIQSHCELFFPNSKLATVTDQEFKQIVSTLLFQSFIRDDSCTLCQFKGSFSYVLKSHLLSKHNSTLETKLLEFQQTPDLFKIRPQAHGPIKVRECFCGKYFTDDLALRNHQMIHSCKKTIGKLKKIRCVMCNDLVNPLKLFDHQSRLCKARFVQDEKVRCSQCRGIVSKKKFERHKKICYRVISGSCVREEQSGAVVAVKICCMECNAQLDPKNTSSHVCHIREAVANKSANCRNTLTPEVNVNSSANSDEGEKHQEELTVKLEPEDHNEESEMETAKKRCRTEGEEVKVEPGNSDELVCSLDPNDFFQFE